MRRLALPCCLGLLFTLPLSASADGARDALALQEALQNAIQEAEPAIACVLVSRSPGYARVNQGPATDGSGKLGAFSFRDALKFLNVRSDDPRVDDLKKLDLGDRANVPESYGSGVVIDATAGLILTNYHVIKDATKIFIRLPGDKEAYADIHAADPRSDLAVLRLLKVPAGLKALKIGDAGKARKGQMVLSIANPFAAGFRDGSPSASWGIISNIRRRAPGSPKEEERKKTLHHYGTLLQTDARLNLGCSGGALIDLKGEMIGLTTALAAISGAETSGGFAVPMDDNLKRIIEVLKRGEEVEYGFLGVELKERAEPGNGVVLDGVTPWGPAFRAGLRRDDTILSVNAAAIRDNEDLFLAISTVLADGEAKLMVQSQGGQPRAVSVTLAKYYVPGPIIVSRKPPSVRGLRVDHLSVFMQVTRTVLPPNQMTTSGVVVREVEAGSKAAAGLKVNQIITHVNGKAVTTPAEFYREAAKVAGALELTLDPDARLVKIN